MICTVELVSMSTFQKYFPKKLLPFREYPLLKISDPNQRNYFDLRHQYIYVGIKCKKYIIR